MSDLTPGQAARAALFTEGYKAGQADARRCTGRGDYDGEYGRGYRLGYAWGLDHPLGSPLLSEATS